MTSKYMSFSPELVNERNNALNNCPTKSGRCQIYKKYYLKMKDAYENYNNAEAQAQADPSEADPSEADPSEADEDDEDYEPSEDEEEYEEEYEEDEDEEEYDEEYEENEVLNAKQAHEAQKADEADEAYEDEAYEDEAEEYCCCEAANKLANKVEFEEDKNEFGCPGCNYEWRDGYKNGWRDAMKYITKKTHKEVPATPACSYCDIVCKTRECGGKCGGIVRYCSVECQKQDWAFGHKNICGK
jgi:hypothetical protein